MTVGLRDVAERCAVSVSTASRALAGSTRVSAGTRERVAVAATELGYRPNANARALRTAQSKFVGLVVTNLVNDSFHVIAEIVQQRLAEHGYQMMLSVTGGDAAYERAALHTLVDHSAAGVILVGSDLRDTDGLRQLGLPVIHLARRPAKPVGDCVLGDELVGARMATEYLVGRGHRRIAIIAGPKRFTSGRERLQGYWLALQQAGLPVRDELVVVGPFVPDTGASAVDRILALPVRRRPTALLVANHEAGYGALPALQQHQVMVPDDLSVVCYEDSLLARWWHPAVTVVDNNAAQMGELAARTLLDRIEGAGGPARQEFRVGTRLIERGSCDSVGRRASATQSFPS